MGHVFRKQIKEGEQALKEVMQLGLASIAEDLIEKIMRNARNSTPSTILDSIKGVQGSGISFYKNNLLMAMSVIANEAVKQARKEIPKASKVKLAETDLFDGDIKFATTKTVDTTLFNTLPSPIKKRVKSAADLLVDTQINDLEKAIFFQFGSSAKSTDSMRQLEFEVKESSIDFIEGNSIAGGASVTAANTVNESRNAFFMDSDVLDEIDAFQFVNGDPVTQICTDLDGTIFEKNDPDMFKYTPPLHYNCRSGIIPILKGDLGKREINKLQSKYDDQIQFSEIEPACKHCSKHFN